MESEKRQLQIIRRGGELADFVFRYFSGLLVVGMRSMPGNPYDGHTLHEAIEQVEILADKRPGMAVVDKGYRGRRSRECRFFDQANAGA